MTMKSIHTYFIVPMAMISVGLSAIEYNDYKAFAWNILRSISKSFSMETRVMDAVNTKFIPINTPQVSFDGFKIETRTINEKAPKALVGLGDNGF
jgi:hypothetical protein